MTMLPQDYPFLDVPMLLETSQPMPRWGGWRLAGAGVIGAAVLAWYFLTQSLNGGGGGDPSLSMMLCVVMTTLVAGWIFNGVMTSREYARQQAQLESIQELIQLRRWAEAALAAQNFLSSPARSAGARGQGLLFLAMVLARYHRFEDSVTVYDHILDELSLDDAAAHSVKLGRAMSLLRAENLLDADRAIAELRRDMRQGAPANELAALALVEMYRDVKTGHPAEAIEMFNLRFDDLRKTLGHRLADGWALVARAYDMLQKNSEAETAYRNATLLAPLPELIRRYPEVAAMKDRLAGARAPAEVI
jgi:tetratricopeptide (TPR) repeat protein